MKKWNKKNKVFKLILFSIILSLFVQVFMIEMSNDKLYSDSEYTSIYNNANLSGYIVDGNKFLTLNNDPQIIFSNINSQIKFVKIEFEKSISEKMNIQIFYAKQDEDFSEKNSVIQDIYTNETEAVIELPYNNYSKLRIDIGNKSDENFELADVKTCVKEISLLEKSIKKIHILNTVILSIIFLAILSLIEKYKSELLKEDNKTLEIIFISFCFIMFTLWAIVQPFNSCPDEAMRYDVIKYIFNYNRLPHGGDPLIIDKIWGFSYAFLPYLSGLVSVVFMKFVSIFTLDEYALILAARMAVVCSGTITVYYVIKIADKCFKGLYKWLFIILVSCLPQFVFLGSYINNDMLALLSVAIMIYYWIEGHEKNWDIKSNIGLSIGVAICLLSYYNAYTFILLSVVFFVWSNLNNNVDKAKIFKKFMLITFIVFIFAGWWFIRNGILYHGDFLGINISKEYSNMYAREDIKPINRMTPSKAGTSILFMLVNMEWIKDTCLSFIGRFGYMNIPIYNWIYVMFNIIIFIGLLAFSIKLFNLIKQKDKKYVLYLSMLFASIINILLSIYNSYTSDFQPQGRYVIACLIPLMGFVTIGFENMFTFIEKRFKINLKKTILIICGCCILISVLCFTRIIVPNYIH